MWAFLNPLFLWAGLAALIPLLLHLLQRRRLVHVRFSTLRFLRLAQKRSARKIRMENFLLWLLRTLVVLALVAAFAIPVLRTERLGRLVGSSARDVAIVLDGSYSMRYTSTQRNVWDETVAAAAAVVEGLRKGDRVCLFVAEDNVRALIAQPSTDLALALSLIKAQQPGNWPSRLKPAIDAAAAALKQSTRRERELHIITDGQAVPWRPPAEAGAAAAAAGEPVPEAGPAAAEPTCFVTLVGPRDPFNAYPRTVDVEPALLMAGMPARVTVQVGHSGPLEPVTISLLVDDREVVRRSLEFTPEKATDELVLPVPALEAGVHHARVMVPADGLALDDELHFLLRVRERLKVLCVGTAEDAFFLMKSLNPAGDVAAGFEVNRVDPDNFAGADLATYSCVFLCNAIPLPGQGLLALEDQVRRGGTLVVFPGDRATPRDYASWTCLPAVPVDVRTVPESERLRTLRLLARKDPFFTGFKLPAGAVPTLALQRELTWGAASPDAMPLMAAGPDATFLWGRTVGLGRVFMYALSADRRWSTFPLSPLFLPLNHQMVQFGAGLGREPLYRWTSHALLLSDVLTGLREQARLVDPDGKPVALRREREGARTLVYADELNNPGVYSIEPSAEERLQPALAVNVDRIESDLTPLPEREIAGRTGFRTTFLARDREDLLRQIDEHRRGRPLGEPLLWLALVLAVAEVALANRMSRRAGTLSDRLGVDDAGRIRTAQAGVG